MSLPPDHQARVQALDTTRSFAVSAPAGSGKTGLLTQRVLALLARCEQPENVLAITFTKKAAAEMQARILKAIRETQQQDQAPTDDFARQTWSLARAVLEQDEKNNWQLLSLPHRLRITTIDGFCRQLSQQSPLHNNLGATPEVLDQPEQAYLLAVRETLKLMEQDDEPLQQDLIQLVKHFNNQLGSLESLLVSLLAKRDQWLAPLFSSRDAREYLEQMLESVTQQHLEKTSTALLPIASDMAILADYAAQNLIAENSLSPIAHCMGLTGLPETSAELLHVWRGVADLLLTSQGDARKTIDKRAGFPAAVKTDSKEKQEEAKAKKKAHKELVTLLADMPKAVELLAQVRGLPTPEFQDGQWQILGAMTRVLHRLVAELTVVFKQMGQTDFTEITLSALHALGEADEPTDLSLLLEYQLQHILVDEFQDTSSTQLDLLSRLTAGWQQDDGHTLFVVGDAMQSCYSFRNANVGIFLRVREQGLGDIKLTPLNLTANFRSQTPVVKWVNRVFREVLPDDNSVNAGAVKYLTADAMIPPLADRKAADACQLDIFYGEDKPKERKQEAERIVQLVQQRQAENPQQSIAILVRTRGQVPAITRALIAHRIRYRATEIDFLADNMAIGDAISLTRALLFPHDRIAWLSLLRAPWCGLDMHDLFAVANAQPLEQEETAPPTLLQVVLSPEDFSLDLSADGQTALAGFSHAIQTVFSRQQRMRLSQWIKQSWVLLGGAGNLLQARDLDNLGLFFKLLEQHEAGGRLRSWDNLIAGVDKLFAKGETDDPTEAIPPVEILTIHKSKGLEYDTVIVPGLDRGSRPDQKELIRWLELVPEGDNREALTDLIISPVNAVGDDKDPVYNYISQCISKKQKLEADRVFYVACTRAVNHLHLLAYAQTEPAKKDDDAASNSTVSLKLKDSSRETDHWLQKIWPCVREEANLIALEDSQGFTQREDKHPNFILRNQHAHQGLQPECNDLLKPWRLYPREAGAEQEANNLASSSALQQRHKRYAGTVLHQLIQAITEGHINAEADLGSLCQSLLRQYGTPAAQAASTADTLLAALDTMRNSRTGQWLLNHQHSQSACEQEHTRIRSGKVRRLSIDRTFVEAGTRWVIDYKSSTPAPDQSLVDFARQEASEYHGQLQSYAWCFAHEDLPVKTALYFPLLDYFYEVELRAN